jgi:TonB-dependent starch-binding outer membrane protein SusC
MVKGILLPFSMQTISILKLNSISMKQKALLTYYVALQKSGCYSRLWLLLLFVFLSSMSHAQSIITGRVNDETGNGMPGVSILLKNTSAGTTTDAMGNYTLNIPASEEVQVLVFSFIGYVSEEETVGGRSVINVSLIPSIETLSEIVVVGYGTQKKSDVTGSLVSVSSEALREVPVANLQQALQGRAAGLEVQRVGTTPGAGARIRIRGDRSVSSAEANDPLIVLDGIPFEGGNLNDINPDEVKSIEILKDASATAIYGSRGANGVILITTKRGSPGENRITFNSYYGISTVARKYPVYNADEYRAMRDTSPWNSGYMAEEIESINTGRSTDWQDLMYKNGYITDHNISVSGGSEKSQYSVGGGYFKETTVLPGQDFNRFTLRITNDLQVGKRIKIGFNSMNTFSTRNGSSINPMFNILALSPLMPAYNSEGEIIRTPAGNLDDQANTYSPLLLKSNDNDWVDRVRRLRTFNSLYAEVKIIEPLKYRLNVGLDYRQEENAQFRGSDSYFRPLQGNTASVNNTVGYGYTLENLLVFDKTFAGKHRVGATGLFSVQKDHTHNTYVAKDSIDQDFVQFYNLGQSNQSSTNRATLSGSENTWGLISYMLRVNYAYNDKYLLTLTGRVDGSSRLTDKWHQYPAVSIGWNIVKEGFMENIQVVSNLKLRAGWGETSNQAVAPYATLGGVTNLIYNADWNTNRNLPVLYNFGENVEGGYYVSTIPSKKLVWEFTKTTNIGLDFGVLNDRITGSIDWYNAQTHNVIYNLELPATSGVPNAYTTNIGRMENKGMEISITSVNIETPGGFSWSTDLNVFWNRNKLLSLQDGFKSNIASGLHIGHPLSAIYDYEKLGIWQLNEAAEAAEFGQLPGQLKIKDISGPEGVPDGNINPDYDRKVIGSGQAKWQGGITNRFKYKGFDLSFVTYARIGGTIVSGVHQPTAAYLTNLDGKRNGLKVDYWTPTNPTNDFPMPSTRITPPNAGNAWTTLGYYDATFVKIRSINLGYTLSGNVLDKIGAHAVRIYTTIQNPFVLFSPYMKAGGVDPEATGTGTAGFVQNGGNIPARALTVATSTPPTRSYILGVNLTF